jgi:hypothetical protein
MLKYKAGYKFVGGGVPQDGAGQALLPQGPAGPSLQKMSQSRGGLTAQAARAE